MNDTAHQARVLALETQLRKQLASETDVAARGALLRKFQIDGGDMAEAANRIAGKVEMTDHPGTANKAFNAPSRL